MKVIIKEIKKSGYDPQEDKIYSFLILGELENGRVVSIRDERPYDLRNYLGKTLDCLIWISFMSKINSIKENDDINIKSPIMRGKYLGEYNISNKWEKCEDFNRFSGYHAIDYEGMIFLISPRDFERQSVQIKHGEEIIFQAAGLELVAWLPIEDEQEQ